MSVTAETTDQANLVICGNRVDSVVSQISFRPNAKPVNLKCSDGVPLFSARASWGGKLNPLINALPEQIDIAVVANDQLDGPAQLLMRESTEHRCGSVAVMDRLVEVLLVRLLRTQLEAGTAQIGLLAGLADSRLAPAIIAIHDSPEASWRVESLAELAGLSVSRFAERFARLVGSTPMSYLRHWRMVLARQDIERGDRIQSVAVRYGYASTEALGRAFKRAHGDKPTAFRSH